MFEHVCDCDNDRITPYHEQQRIENGSLVQSILVKHVFVASFEFWQLDHRLELFHVLKRLFVLVYVFTFSACDH